MPILEVSDGTELFYNDWGTGSPVILIHGWPLNSDMWEHQQGFLVERGFRVISYDRRGFGRSSQPWDGYDYDTFAGDLNDLIEELDLEGVALVGFSMGGGEVVRYLSRYGDSRVRRAVLISAVTPYLQKTSDNPDGVDPAAFATIADSLREDRPAFLKQFGPQFYGRSMVKHTVSEAVLEWSQMMALTGSLRATLAAADAWSTTDFRPDLAAIRVPVRVIHGDSDKTVPIESSGRLTAKLIPGATLSEYEGEPHGLYWTASDRLNAELLEFLSAVTTSSFAPPI
jgi:pimeloyl-ACP methyl ester carboxylesterase